VRIFGASPAETPGTKHRVPNCRCRAPEDPAIEYANPVCGFFGDRCPVSGTGYLKPGTWYPAPEPVRRRAPKTEPDHWKTRTPGMQDKGWGLLNAIGRARFRLGPRLSPGAGMRPSTMEGGMGEMRTFPCPASGPKVGHRTWNPVPGSRGPASTSGRIAYPRPSLVSFQRSYAVETGSAPRIVARQVGPMG
jgi:hypothetical protein